MINIAVLVYDLINDYNDTVVNALYEYFKDKSEVRLIVAPVNVPHSEVNNYDYQYWSSVKILQSQQIDGVIIIPNSFSNHIDYETLTKELQGFSGKPAVSIARAFNLPGCKYTYNECDLAYEQVIEHLKNKHDRKRIGFFGAGLVDSEETKVRFEAYKKALEKNNLEYDESIVFNGDFTPGTARDVLAEKIKSKADLNFDAICCVNDYTCGGCLLVFDSLGIKCPDDVILVGYDDSEFGTKTDPSLSTINQGLEENASKAGELLYKTIKGEPVEEKSATHSNPIYRQSCGCVSKKAMNIAYCDNAGNYYDYDKIKRLREINSIKKHQEILFSIYNMINLMDNKVSLERISEALRPAVLLSDFSAIMIALYDTPLTISCEDNIELPETVRIQTSIDISRDTVHVFPLNQGKQINLKERIAPEEFEHYDGGLYYLHPIFIHNKNYGYMICKANNQEYILSSIDMKVISDIVVNTYDYSLVLQQHQKLVENNINLTFSAKTDELTKIFNRRGITDYGQRLIDLSVAMEKTGTVFFFDLDGLKKINDTYGHKIGDLAIKTEAEVLKACFRNDDLVGRLSGDEFCAIAPGFPVDRLDILRNKLLENNKKYSEEAGLPFILSISFGACGFDAENTDLTVLLQTADHQLYKEKELKHSKI